MLAAAILGVMVIGGMTNELVVVQTPLTIGEGESATRFQEILDGILPGMLSLGITGFYYYLLKKKSKRFMDDYRNSYFGIICAQFGILN
ncbi:PTS system mannose/fructose/sorbose family transporter subunit IID [Enterococcus gallinarum]|nr:PTS system mannose/fructose/sorbose family transporter subunit IID [Enterococcus gallinarum]